MAKDRLYALITLSAFSSVMPERRIWSSILVYRRSFILLTLPPYRACYLPASSPYSDLPVNPCVHDHLCPLALIHVEFLIQKQAWIFVPVWLNGVRKEILPAYAHRGPLPKLLAIALVGLRKLFHCLGFFNLSVLGGYQVVIDDNLSRERKLLQPREFSTRCTSFLFHWLTPFLYLALITRAQSSQVSRTPARENGEFWFFRRPIAVFNWLCHPSFPPVVQTCIRICS